ncbi:MAG: phosphoribosyl-AMP cyclohydrolase [Rhodospirillaceae bacterium]|nr:phosphoribosyl-AMP cyclohydrolase [Rhodospirillaceae bacterium]
MADNSRWSPWLAIRATVAQVEEGGVLAPKFDQRGLLPAVVTDATSGEVLMLGYMNAEALIRSIDTGEAHYWSRTRQRIWHKGASSGQVHKIVEMRIDDDQDSVWPRVAVGGIGGSCHVGYRSCFYRSVDLGLPADRPVSLRFQEQQKLFDPSDVYGDADNPTIL